MEPWHFATLALSRALALSLLLLVATGCRDETAPANPPSATSPQAQAPASFVNKVWSVRASSSVAPGTLYTFLSDGTLVITSINSKPALGRWQRDGDGLTMIEEGIPYKATIATLTADTFAITIANPGEPVTITFAPAPALP